jgi:hypothetical protein
MWPPLRLPVAFVVGLSGVLSSSSSSAIAVVAASSPSLCSGRRPAGTTSSWGCAATRAAAAPWVGRQRGTNLRWGSYSFSWPAQNPRTGFSLEPEGRANKIPVRWWLYCRGFGLGGTGNMENHRHAATGLCDLQQYF